MFLRLHPLLACSAPRPSSRAVAWARRGADRWRRGRSSSPRAPSPLSAPALPLMVAGEAKLARRRTDRPPLRSPRASLSQRRVQRRCEARAAAVLAEVDGRRARRTELPCLDEARPACGSALPADCANYATSSLLADCASPNILPRRRSQISWPAEEARRGVTGRRRSQGGKRRCGSRPASASAPLTRVTTSCSRDCTPSPLLELESNRAGVTAASGSPCRRRRSEQGQGSSSNRAPVHLPLLSPSLVEADPAGHGRAGELEPWSSPLPPASPRALHDRLLPPAPLSLSLSLSLSPVGAGASPTSSCASTPAAPHPLGTTRFEHCRR
jgi:hypothetical protein